MHNSWTDGWIVYSYQGGIYKKSYIITGSRPCVSGSWMRRIRMRSAGFQVEESMPCVHLFPQRLHVSPTGLSVSASRESRSEGGEKKHSNKVTSPRRATPRSSRVKEPPWGRRRWWKKKNPKSNPKRAVSDLFGGPPEFRARSEGGREAARRRLRFVSTR